MRGAGMRLGLDVRRLWRCPRCGAERKLPADVTSIRCSACANPPFMQIVEPQRRPRPTPKPLNPFITVDLDTPEEGEPRNPPPATQNATEVPVENVVVQATTAPASPHESVSPPPKRNDRRGKNRRQRDRQGRPDRPPQSSGAAPLAESPAPTSSPDVSSAIPVSPPPDAAFDAGPTPQS